jgi:hypothetical protein
MKGVGAVWSRKSNGSTRARRTGTELQRLRGWFRPSIKQSQQPRPMLAWLRRLMLLPDQNNYAVLCLAQDGVGDYCDRPDFGKAVFRPCWAAVGLTQSSRQMVFKVDKGIGRIRRNSGSREYRSRVAIRQVAVLRPHDDYKKHRKNGISHHIGAINLRDPGHLIQR